MLYDQPSEPLSNTTRRSKSTIVFRVLFRVFGELKREFFVTKIEDVTNV